MKNSILIVDDDTDTIENLVELIEDCESLIFDNIYTANNELEAIKFIDTGSVAIAIFDIVMENDESGLTLVQYVRNKIEDHTMQIIIRTENPNDLSSTDLTMKYDISGYIEKQFSNKKLFLNEITIAKRIYARIHSLNEIIKQRTAKLAESEKQAAMATMSAGISHEIGNALNGLAGAKAMLEKEISNQESGSQPNISYLKTIAEKIGRGINRSNQVVRDMSIRTSSKETVFPLLKAVKDAEEASSSKRAEANVTLDISGVPKEQKIKFSEGKLSQILLNLISNACDAIKSSGTGDTIKISAHFEKRELVMTCEDNGPGVPAEIKSKIFDPYFTTKEVGKGTGVGLFVIKTLLGDGKGEGHDIELLEGNKTCFKLTFKNQVFEKDGMPDAIASAVKKENVKANTPAKPVMMIIDDDPEIHDTCNALHADHFEIHYFYRAKPAFEDLSRLKPNLILLDLELPDFDIPQVNKLLNLFPELNVYIHSGHQYEYVTEGKGLEIPKEKFLDKHQFDHFALSKPWTGKSYDYWEKLTDTMMAKKEAVQEVVQARDLSNLPVNSDGIPLLSLRKKEIFMQEILAYYLDDEKENHLTMTALAPKHWSIECFATREELLVALNKTQPHLLILDVRLGADDSGPKFLADCNDKLNCEVLWLTGYKIQEIDQMKLQTPRIISGAKLKASYLGGNRVFQKPINRQFFEKNEPFIRMRNGDFSYIKPKILFIDDEPENFDALKALAPANWDLVFCEDPYHAIKMIGDHNPVVIITDFNMPNVDGGVIEKVAAANHSCLETVVLSGHPEDYIMEKYPGLGCKVFKKPVDEKFIKYIEDVLEKVPSVYFKHANKLDDLRKYEADFIEWTQKEIDLLFTHGVVNLESNDDFYTGMYRKLSKNKIFCHLDERDDFELHSYWNYKIGTAEEIIQKNLNAYVKKRLERILCLGDLKTEVNSKGYFVNFIKKFTTEHFFEQLGERFHSLKESLSEELIQISLEFATSQNLVFKVNEKVVPVPVDSNYPENRKNIGRINQTINLFLMAFQTARYLEGPAGDRKKSEPKSGQQDLQQQDRGGVNKMKGFFKKLIS